MKVRAPLIVAACSLILASAAADAADLVTVYQRALQNDPQIREKHGSKSFLLTPVIAASWARDAKVISEEFLFDASDRQEMARCAHVECAIARTRTADIYRADDRAIHSVNRAIFAQQQQMAERIRAVRPQTVFAPGRLNPSA